MVKISASILSANLAKLEDEINMLTTAGVDFLHIDVMDGHFVSNLTFGPVLIKAIRGLTNLPFDVHLMIDNPEKSLKQYSNVGANIITIHPETVKHLDRLLYDIKILSIKTSIALLPTTNINVIDYILDKIDIIMIMSVNPGFEGQFFIDKQLDKIKHLNKYLIDLGVRDKIQISVDGGVNDLTEQKCVEAGVDILVSGSYIFSGNYKNQINLLKTI